ncbi:hypothetical protein COO60DRAFT_1561301, partial [Scenedesmus sp. NREL 46B-D3]
MHRRNGQSEAASTMSAVLVAFLLGVAVLSTAMYKANASIQNPRADATASCPPASCSLSPKQQTSSSSSRLLVW